MPSDMYTSDQNSESSTNERTKVPFIHSQTFLKYGTEQEGDEVGVTGGRVHRPPSPSTPPDAIPLSDRPRRRKDREIWWSVVAISIGLVYVVIASTVAVPILERSFGPLVEKLGGSGEDDATLSPTFPANGANVLTSTITLSWSSRSDAERYEVRISEDGSMSSPTLFATFKNSLAITGLELGSIYYWQVRPVVDGERGEWSEVWSFTVGRVSGAPVATSPLNSTIYIDELPVLTWTAVQTSSNYMVQVSTDADFSEMVVSAEVDSTTYALNGPFEENVTYYWRVAGYVDGERTEWSAVSTFFLSPTEIQISRSWTFYVDGSEWSLSVNVSAEDYYTAKYTTRTPMFSVNGYAAFVTSTDGTVEEIADILSEMAQSKGYDRYTTACFVLSFVQDFTYSSDENTTGSEDYPRYPVETVVEGTGDCEDTSALFASLIQAGAFGMDAVLVSLSTPTSDVGHMAVGLYLDEEDVPSEVILTYDGTTYTMSKDELLTWDVRSFRFGASTSYYYCEPTSEMPIGWPTDICDWYYTLIPC